MEKEGGEKNPRKRYERMALGLVCAAARDCARKRKFLRVQYRPGAKFLQRGQWQENAGSKPQFQPPLWGRAFRKPREPERRNQHDLENFVADVEGSSVCKAGHRYSVSQQGLHWMDSHFVKIGIAAVRPERAREGCSC